MSEGYAESTALVGATSERFDRALDATIALTIVSFLLGLLTITGVVQLDAAGGALRGIFVDLLVVTVGAFTLVGGLSALGIVPITSDRVRGIGLGLVLSTTGLAVAATLLPVSLATLLGSLLLVEAALVLAAGLSSRLGIVRTDAARTPGLLTGLAFGIVGLLVGAGISGTALGGPIGYYGGGLVGGLGGFVLTVLPREDLGSALPVALLVGVLGGTVATGAIGLGWSWSPGPAIDGSFTGQVVVPLFVLLGSITSGWGAAKARARYGARGRQYGAFLVVYLNALSMVAIMLSIVAFVTLQGFAYAFHDVAIGALTAIVLLAPLAVMAANFARRPAGSADWHGSARQFVRVAPLAAVGALVAMLALVQIRGEPIQVPFTYTVFQNRDPVPLDTAATVVTEPVVGALPLLLVGAILTWYFLRRYASIRGVGSHGDRTAAVERAVGLSLGLLAVQVLALVVPLPGPLSAVGILAGALGWPIVVAGALAGGVLAVAAVGSLALGPGTLAERAVERAQVIRVGLFGGLALMLGAVLLEATSGAVPALGPIDLVPSLAIVGAVAALSVALATGAAARSGPRARQRLYRREGALGLGAASGFVALMASHGALTGATVEFGPLTVSTTGTLSWPMTMQPYVPLSPNPGGIMPAVVGTMWLVVGAATFAVPLGVGAAVFLTEYAEQGRITALVEVATNALWSTPSIVFGLFGAAFLIPRLGGDESLLSGMFVLGFMLLPLVLITSREAIKSVPDEYRDASAALGVSRWETIRSVVLPAAIPGVITGVILGVGRIAGETAPLILVLGSTLNATEAIDVLGGFEFVAEPPFIANPALLESAAALPTQVWAVIAAGVSGSPAMGWASALVLLLVVLSFYAIGIAARTYFRRKLNYE